MNRSQIEALPELTDSRQAAGLLGISWRQVQRMAKAGTIPAVKVGKLWRFPKGKLLAFAGIGGE